MISMNLALQWNASTHYSFISAKSDNDIITVVRQMQQQDANAAKAGDITVNYQNMASHSNFDHDNAPLP